MQYFRISLLTSLLIASGDAARIKRSARELEAKSRSSSKDGPQASPSSASLLSVKAETNVNAETQPHWLNGRPRWPFTNTKSAWSRWYWQDEVDARLATHWNSHSIVANANQIAGMQGGVATNAANIAANTNAIGSVANHAASNTATLASHASQINGLAAQATANAHGIGFNAANIAGLTTNVGMLSGSVATNTASIASLTAEVAVLSEAAAPTVALASALGVSVETVATLSLAGSFAGPIMGCILLVYVCWPQEETDPWLQIESRVARMIDDRFNEERRKRLSGRLKRYITSFSHCSSAWVKQAMSSQHSPATQSMLQKVAHKVSGGEIWSKDPELNEKETINKVPLLCMAQLEGHMSLERDEWLSDQGDSLSSLFMPFANMHTEMLTLLADWSPDSADLKWPFRMGQAAGEYASFMLEHMLKAWKSQVCRTMRVRHSIKTKVFSGQFFKWRYEFVVLKPIWQPNAGEYCEEQCGSTGWCNYCGGRGQGACCILGGTQGDKPQDPSECAQFQPPLDSTWPYQPYHTCVHTDCVQSNMYFTSSKELEGPHEIDAFSETGQCQEFCQQIPGATVFNFKPDGYGGFKCECLGGANATIERYYWKGALSGPTVCPERHIGKTDEEKQEMPSIPMEQVHPCEKSPLVSDMDELEEKHPQWLKQCYTNASKVVAEDFNPFYRRFAMFVDKLSWNAGCGNTTGENKEGSLKDWDDENWNRISEAFDFGTFTQCDWKREAERDDGTWQADDVFQQGWTGTSRINYESQKKVDMGYPAPHWLERLRRARTCLAGKGSGGEGTDKKSDLLGEILQDPKSEGGTAAPAKPALPDGDSTPDAFEEIIPDSTEEVAPVVPDSTTSPLPEEVAPVVPDSTTSPLP